MNSKILKQGQKRFESKLRRNRKTASRESVSKFSSVFPGDSKPDDDENSKKEKSDASQVE